MRKIGFLFLILVLITGCQSKKDSVGMIMEKGENGMISMHYPITHIFALDKIITRHVGSVYQDFQENVSKINTLQPELNMDYRYAVYQKRWVNVTLFTYIYDYSFVEPKESVFSWVYDKKEKCFLTLEDVILEEKFSSFASLVKQELLKRYKNDINLHKLEEICENSLKNNVSFSLQPQELILYFEEADLLDHSSSRYLTLTLPLSSIPFRLELGKEEAEVLSNEEIPVIDNLIDPTKPVIALTFDDGPTAYTSDILEILKRENAVATFFVLGNKVDMYQDVIRNAVSLGNEIGNHSYNHKWLSRLSISDIRWQIDATQEKIEQITGRTPRYLRPTYGSINQKIRSATDLNIVLWDIDPKDWKKKQPRAIAEDVLEVAEDGKIVLLHDNHKRTVDALSILIPKLKEEGYQFVTLSELEEVNYLRSLY